MIPAEDDAVLAGEGMVRLEQGRAVPTSSQQYGLFSAGVPGHKVPQIVLDPVDRPQLFRGGSGRRRRVRC